MLDKIRLHAAGRLPEGYNVGTAKWTWFDSRCTRFLGVEYEALVERTLAGGTDEEIFEWCLERGRRPSAEEIEIWNEFMIKRGWRDSSSEALREAKRLRGFGHRDDIQTAFDFHKADEETD
jgi:gluconokinase